MFSSLFFLPSQLGHQQANNNKRRQQHSGYYILPLIGASCLSVSSGHITLHTCVPTGFSQRAVLGFIVGFEDPHMDNSGSITPLMGFKLTA
jgi:hypothetical protein